MDIYEFYIKIGRLSGCQLDSHLQGAYVFCYIPANDLENAIHKMKKKLKDDRYKLIDINEGRRLDLDDWEADEDTPEKLELEDACEMDYCLYSSFYGFSQNARAI